MRQIQESLLANALCSVANAVFITDRLGRIIWANKAFSRLCGYSIEELTGRTPALLKSGMEQDTLYAQLWQTILAGNAWRGVITDRRKDGALYSVDETITPLMDEQGAITHFIAIQHDITKRRKEQERDHDLAYHDALTGLPNRLLLLDLQRQAIARATHANVIVAILFLDLDSFKPVNDVYGHIAGDRLLRAVAERLTAAIRKSDTVARIGGDEFVILLTELDNAAMAAGLALKLTETIARPFMIAEQEIRISASVGIALYPNDGEDPEELMRKADQAMYEAKKSGGNAYRFSGA